MPPLPTFGGTMGSEYGRLILLLQYWRKSGVRILPPLTRSRKLGVPIPTSPTIVGESPNGAAFNTLSTELRGP